MQGNENPPRVRRYSATAAPPDISDSTLISLAGRRPSTVIFNAPESTVWRDLCAQKDAVGVAAYPILAAIDSLPYVG